jgi:beta-xylosidase
VELENGESWFYHFQDKDAYGRVVHMQPMKWKDDWPVMGSDMDGDGIGEPVSKHRYPDTGYKGPLFQVQTSDEFNSPIPGLQWQWHANPEAEWMFLSGSEGYMRLYCQHNSQEDPNLWEVPHLYLQKFPEEKFTATVKLSFFPKEDGDRVGLVIMGMSYSALVIEQADGELYYTVMQNLEAAEGGNNMRDPLVSQQSGELYLRVRLMDHAKCSFSISSDGENFTPTGEVFKAEEGKWIGAKVGLFAIGSKKTNDTGWADVDWFRISKAK